MKIQVTQEDIDNAHNPSFRSYPTCSMGCALERVWPSKNVMLWPTYGEIDGVAFAYSDEMKVFGFKFDNDIPVEPFEFELEIP